MWLSIVLITNVHAEISQSEFMNFISNNKDPNVSDLEYNNLYKAFFSNIKPSNNPEIIILAGGPGSGKTTFRKEKLNRLENFYLHDVDEVIVRLQGYKADTKKYGKMKAYNKWWPIGKKIVNQFLEYAFLYNLNVIYDRACCIKESFDSLHYAVLNKKYKARMYAFYVSEKVALDRVKKRAETENREILPDTIKECRRLFSNMFENYLEFLPDVTLYCHGKVCLKKENKIIKSINSKAYNEFLNKKSS